MVSVADVIQDGTLTAEWIQTASLKALVEKCTDPKSPPDKLEYYQLIHLEIIDRFKASTKDCKELAVIIHKILPMDNSIR